MDDVIETALEQDHERGAGVAFTLYRLVEVFAELPLEHAVIVLDLLLFAEVDTVVGEFAATLLVHARSTFASFDCAFRRIATRAFEEELESVATAEATNRSGVSCHGSLWLLVFVCDGGTLLD